MQKFNWTRMELKRLARRDRRNRNRNLIKPEWNWNLLKISWLNIIFT